MTGNPIKPEERAAFVQAVVKKYLLPVLAAKGNDYSSYATERYGGSAHANFMALADMLGDPAVDKYRVWLIYFGKHLQSVFTWMRARAVASEPLTGRITDLLNYLLIFWMMLVEDGLAEDPRGVTDA